MEMTPQEELDMKNALKGKLTDNYDDLEKLLVNLTTKKSNTRDHGTFKFIEKAMTKIHSKMKVIKA